MNSVSTLTFQWSLWTILLAVSLFAATMVFSWVAWQRSDFRRSVLLLELLRLISGGIGRAPVESTGMD
jgi:hypothetical protein